jgi:hypothetical protein
MLQQGLERGLRRRMELQNQDRDQNGKDTVGEEAQTFGG